MSRNQDPASHNTSTGNRIAGNLIRYVAPLGAFGLLLAVPQTAGAATARPAAVECIDTGPGASWSNGWTPVVEFVPLNVDSNLTVGQMIGTEGIARQEKAWSEIRGELYRQLGCHATESGAVLQVVGDVGVSYNASDADVIRASEQAAELTDVAAGQLNMERGGGPAEAFPTEEHGGMVLFVTINAPGTAPTVNFAQATQPMQASYGQKLPLSPPEW